MRYEAKICHVCGSTEIKPISTEQIEEDVFVEYKCLACDSVFKPNPPKKPKRPVEEPKPVIEQKPISNEQTAVDVFKASSGFVYEILCCTPDQAVYGSGLLLESGEILSNAHLVNSVHSKEPARVRIYARRGPGDDEVELDIVAVDEERDLILFAPQDELGKGVDICPRIPETGEKCFAIGNPKGQGISIFEGIVSANRRRVEGLEYIMFSAPVTHGNSGGPLFDSKGNPIGIVTFGRGDAVGMNYAISHKTIEGFLYKARTGE